MAKIDEIKAQIHKAQAEAVRNSSSLSAATPGSVVKESQKIVRQNIAAQQATKQSSSGQAETPALPEVADTRTTQQKYNDAQKAYDDYLASPEYRQRQSENNQKALQEAMQRIFAAGASASDLPMGYAQVAPQADAQEQELKATVEHYRQQMDQEESQRIRDADMKEIESWSDEDREQLQKYISSDSKTGNLLVNSNPLLWFVANKSLGDSAKYLYGKYGEEKTKQLASSYSRYLNETEAEKIEKDTKNAVDQGTMSTIGQNILGLGTRLFGGLQATADRFGEALDRDERYPTLAPYTSGDLISLHGNTVTAQTAQNIAGEDGGILRQGAAYLYQGGMTMMDSFLRAAAGGGATGGAAIAACNAFSQTVSQASQQGATPEQAYTLGAAVAGVEYLSEKIPMDEVFKLAKGGNVNVLKQAFKQTGIEISTEELSLLGSMAAEAAILREKSSYKQQIGDLVANGASYEEAKAQADKGVWEEVKQTALVSGFAGFLSGGGGAIVGNLTAQPEAAAETVQETADAASVEEAVQPETTSFLDDAAQQIAQEAPAAAPVELTPEQQMVEQAAAETMGVPSEAQPTVDTNQTAEYDNNTITVPGATVGRSDVTYTADNKPVQFRYAVVPAESLVTSNDQYGNVNSAYPAELQPRDRTRAASQTQINSISRNLNPALLAESPTAQNGAPIIRGDGVVIGGNGRVSAITQAYGAGRGAEYQQYITQRAAELGIDPATLPANPVLVRVTDGVDNYTELANSLNASTTASYSATEAANADAGKIGDIIEYLSVSEDGGINTADNRDFIQKFVAHVVPETERGDVMQANGQLSQAGERRIQNALFAYAYGDTALVERLAESTDNNAKNITNAMMGAAGKVAQLQTEINRGEVQDLGLQNAITDAVNLYLDAKAGKQTVEDAAGQLSIGDNGPEAQHDGLTVNLAKFMESNNRSGKQIRDFIDTLIDVNMNATADTATEISMFDTGERQTQEGLYDEAVTAYDQQRDGKGRIPEKSDFSQYRQYQPGELAGGVVEGRTEGNPGTAVPDGRIPQTVPADAPGGQRNLTEQNPGTVGAMQSQFKHEVKQSKVYGNTYQNTPYADIHDIGRAAKKADPNIDQYDVITEAESVHEAELRTETGRDRLAEHRALMKKDGWTGADNDTAMRLLTVYRREGKKDRFLELSRKQRQMGTQAGQMVQSFAKYSREDATVAVQDAIADLDELTIDQVDRKFWKPEQKQKGSQGKKDAFQTWKESITGSLLEVANDIENVEDGDKASMKDLVRQIANLRHTTAWAGYSSDLSRRTERGLDKMDFDTLKTVAKTQLSMIPNDFRKRDTGEILKQIRVQNMLFTLTTKFKNDAGNITNGLMDAVSDSFSGRMIDAVIGEWTGRRTVSNDLKFAREYSKAARDAGDVAAAFVSLDIPMETDAKYSSGRTRTWTPNTSNMLGRLMSAYEKHMKYALEVSDKFYEGGAAHVVSRSLESLGEKSGLTPEQIRDIAQKTGERRTFKDPGTGVNKDGTPKNGRAFARTNVGLQKALNNIGTENVGLGDMLMPFAAVSGEVKQVGMDYTGGGLISGMKEIISIAKDVRNGKEIDPYRQRTAATNFGRGMTGVGLIAAFTAFAAAGAVKVHNDRDSEERMMNQTQGLSGAQWNLNSSLRWWEATMNGASPEEAAKAAEWQSGDELITIDFLEPYNTQMHIGYLLSQGEDIPTAIMQGNFNSLLEMPMMQTLSDLADLQQAFTEVSDGDMDGVRDAAGQLVGTVAGSIVPNWMRKTAQVIDPYYRDTYDTNPFRKAAKEVVAATPILSAALPKKYDNLGKEQRRFDESEWMAATFDNLVTPWDTDTYQTNPVYQEIERLNAIDGINVTPPQAKRKITYTDNTGKEHENYNLSSEQYETMQRIQGQTTMKLLAEITMSEDYKALNDLQKAEVYSDLYSYAQEQAKRQVLPDYFSESAAWMDSISEDAASGLIHRAALAPINSNVGDIVDALENGWAVDPAAKKELDTLYDSYAGMSREAREQILDNAISNTAKYLEIRSRGISTDQYIDVVGDIKQLEVEPDYAEVRPIQIREAIAENDSLSRVEKDYVMKAYMTDYDPTAKSPEKTELKYDAIRDLGVSPEGYTAAYRDYLDASGTGKRRRTIAYYMKTYGWDRSTAQKVYDIYAGYYKPWE